MFRVKISPVGFALASIVGVALGLRTCLNHGIVFAPSGVKFQGMDAWYHMRLVENLVHHFPHRINFDPFALYPGGEDMAIGPFFDLLIAFFILLLNPFSPSAGLIDAVGAYFPAVLGALLAIPVYFVGRELFNTRTGLLAAGLVAVLPGGLLGYSLLGSADHHVAESFLTTVTMLFLILAVKRAASQKLSFHTLWTGDWRTNRQSLAFALLAGLALGCYLLTWMRGAMLVMLITAWITLQYVLDCMRRRLPDSICIVGFPCLLVGLLMILPFRDVHYMEYTLDALAGGLLIITMLSVVSFVVHRKKIKPAYHLLATAAAAGVALKMLYFAAPSGVRWFLAESTRLTPRGILLTVEEVKPLLFLSGAFSLAPVWARFTSCFFLALISLAIVAWLVVKDGRADKSLLLVWSTVILIATLGQNRFTYYFVVNVAVLTGYLCSYVLEWGGFRKRIDPKASLPQAEKTTHVLAVAAVFFWVFYPNIGLAIKGARYDLGPDPDWNDALVWMRDNTPPPFPDPGFYYARYTKPATGEHYRYPASAYGVMSWWDYGYWIIKIAHRIPNTNPTQAGAREAATFLTAQDEPSGSEWLDKLGSRYVIVDGQLGAWHVPGEDDIAGKFPALATWAGKKSGEFFEVYYRKSKEGTLTPVLIYYPEYYKTMMSRLYLFDGKSVVPENSTWAISYAGKRFATGEAYKEISELLTFSTYEQAESFVEAHTASHYRLIGMNPRMSCIPLEKLQHYQLVYRSPARNFPDPVLPPAIAPPSREISAVKIFEYKRAVSALLLPSSNPLRPLR